MVEPLFWLGLLSALLVAVCLTVVLVVALLALQELARAARSAEKLFDTLSRELPPTLEAIRLTGLEISDLTDDVNDGVQSARNIVKQVDRSIDGTKQQIEEVGVTTRSVLTGVRAAWRSLYQPRQRDRYRTGRSANRSVDYPSPSRRGTVDLPRTDGNTHSSTIQENLDASNSVEQGSKAGAPSNLPSPSESTSQDSIQ